MLFVRVKIERERTVVGAVLSLFYCVSKQIKTAVRRVSRDIQIWRTGLQWTDALTGQSIRRPRLCGHALSAPHPCPAHMIDKTEKRMAVNSMLLQVSLLI